MFNKLSCPLIHKEIETSRHLFQPPLYRDSKGFWSDNFTESVQNCPNELHLDVSAVTSYLSYGYVCNNRTMIREVTRRPWLSQINDSGEVVFENVPSHGFFTGDADKIADRLYNLLSEEARSVCLGRSNIFLLLSGGLDSRIIAGVFAKLYHSGDLPSKPIAVTWGAPNSRDVVYASEIAKALKLEWFNAPFGPETVLENIKATACSLGMMHSPEMLHNMLWFKNVPPDSLVIAGSFGDSIGRAEFMGKRLLQLKRQSPTNLYNILNVNAYNAGAIGVERDIADIYSRAEGQVPYYARHEHFMQGYRMRGGLCHALSIINSFATIYQMFTTPQVFQFMWSLHPVRRDDEIYASLLQRKLPEISFIPWPRTNRALRGETVGARQDLSAQYHEYTKWCSGPLYDALSKRIDPDWFESNGIFNPESIRKLGLMVRSSNERVGRLNDIWIWLAGFRSFIDHLEQLGKKVVVEFSDAQVCDNQSSKIPISIRLLTYAAGKSSRVNNALKTFRTLGRKAVLTFQNESAKRNYPPVQLPD